MTEKSMDMFEQLKLFIQSRIPVTWLVTSEETRAERGIANYARFLEYKGSKSTLGIWSLTGGKRQAGGWSELPGWQKKPFNGTPLPDEFQPDDPIGDKMAATPHGGLLLAMNWATEHPIEPAILIIRDAHCFLKNDYWRRALKDAESKLRNTLTSIVCISCTDEVPQDIKRNLAFIRPGLPTLKALQRLLKPTIEALKIENVTCYDCASALRGLTSQQAIDLLTLDYTMNNGNVSVERLSKLKAKELASVHGVSFEGDISKFEGIGGYEKAKDYVQERSFAFGEQARAAQVDLPKGLVLVGVPGNGKTTLAKAIAGELKKALIIFNPSACEGGIVGETATRVAEAIATMDALSPCIIVIDEIEKIFGGEGNLDGGSKSGMLRMLLIWLEEKKEESFVVVTANDISKLPPELLRSGRFDATFWCDLPYMRERIDILKIHLNKRNRSLTDNRIKKVAAKLEGFTGSEIEQVVKDAHLKAFVRECKKQDGTLTVDDLIGVSDDITPLSVSYQEKLAELRAWAKVKARFASAPDPDDKPRLIAKPEKRGEAPAPGTPLFKEASGFEAW